MHHFGAQNGPFAPNKNFFGKNYIIFIYLLAPFIVQNLKESSYNRSRVTRVCHFWAQNNPFVQMIFFSKNMLISLASFIHAYLHAKNQSQIFIY